MRSSIRYALTVVGILVGVGAVAVHSASRSRLAIPPERTWTEVVIPANAAVVPHLVKKEAIIQNAIAGRVTMLEAAAACKALEAHGPPYPGWIGPVRPTDMSEEEFYCRRVIESVNASAPRGQAERLTRSLEAELSDRMREGTLLFPDAIPETILPAVQ